MTRGGGVIAGSEDEDNLIPMMANSPSPPSETAKEPGKRGEVVVKCVEDFIREDEPPPLPLPRKKEEEKVGVDDDKDKTRKPISALAGLRFLLNKCKLSKFKSEPENPVSSDNDNGSETSINVEENEKEEEERPSDPVPPTGATCESPSHITAADVAETIVPESSPVKNLKLSPSSSLLKLRAYLDLDDHHEEENKDESNNVAENVTPKVARRQRSNRRSSLNKSAIESEEPVVEGQDFTPPPPPPRRSSRQSFSKYRNGLVENKTNESGSASSRRRTSSTRASTSSTTSRSVMIDMDIKMKECSVQLRRCDYRLRVNAQFQYSHKPTAVDERSLIRSLKKLKDVIHAKQEARREQQEQLDQAKAKRASLRNSAKDLPLTVSSSITAPAQKRKLLRIKKKKKTKKKCKDCSKAFPNQFQLQRHILKKHFERKRPYPCELCDKAFYQKVHMYNHMRVHTGETPYKCQVCQKAFTHNSQLVVHRRVHNNKKKVVASFNCPRCKKSFPTYIQRKLHIKTHHLPKKLLYRCSICGKCCSSIRLLKLHSLHAHSPNEIKTMEG